VLPIFHQKGSKHTTKCSPFLTRNSEHRSQIHQNLFLFGPGGCPLKTRSVSRDGFEPKRYFCMFCRRFPRSFGPPCGTRWGDFRPLFLFGTLLGRSNGGSCGGSVLTPFFISNFDQKCTIGKSKT
jgi:hypothetical protein